jgi:hypothetical protein
MKSIEYSPMKPSNLEVDISPTLQQKSYLVKGLVPKTTRVIRSKSKLKSR